MKNIKISVFWFLLPLLLLATIFVQNIFPICILLIFVKLFLAERETIGVYLLMYGGALGGITRTVYPSIPIYGLMLNVAGLLLLWAWCRRFFMRNNGSLLSMSLVVLVFLGSYLMSDYSAYATKKLVSIIIHGYFMLIGYFVYANSSKINNDNLAQLLLMTAIAYIAFVTQLYGVRLTSLFDFNSLRNTLESYYYIEGNASLIGYQDIGMAALFSAAFLLSENTISSKKVLFVLIIASLIILLSSARQAILGLLVIIFMRFVLAKQTSLGKKIPYIILGAFVVFVALQFILGLGMDSINATKETGGNGRDIIMLDAIRIFLENPTFGVGLGGFATYTITDAAWPHNVILEILCETGIVGAIILIIIIISYFRKNNLSIGFRAANNRIYFLVVFALLSRVLVSSDLSESIELFSAIFAVSKTLPLYQNVVKTRSSMSIF